jgi:hypothetical protein
MGDIHKIFWIPPIVHPRATKRIYCEKKYLSRLCDIQACFVKRSKNTEIERERNNQEGNRETNTNEGQNERKEKKIT